MTHNFKTDPKVLVISGSSRSDGNTSKAIAELSPFSDYELIDLRSRRISHYDYDFDSSGDDFLSIAEQMVQADVIVFATPVYWYSMSGLMKVFFDRLTELITRKKPLGRALKGKAVYLIVVGTGKSLPEGFENPFRSTSKYFEMDFKQTFYQQRN